VRQHGGGLSLPDGGTLLCVCVLFFHKEPFMPEIRTDDIETLAARYHLENNGDTYIDIWREMVSRFGPTRARLAINKMKETLEILGD
jgi:hypothetical protein